MKLSEKNQESAKRCVMCGLCLPHCPTYNKTQNEAESPRGRISLILALHNEQLAADEGLRSHLDSCLLCRACENKCPSGVTFGEIMDDARQSLAPPPTAQQIKLDRLVLDKRYRRQQARLLWLADTTGLRKLGRALGITRAAGLAQFDQLAPSIKRPHSWQNHYPSQQPGRGNVALFTGCFGDMFDQTTLDSAILLLNACGYGVYVPPRQGCCGALHQHRGDQTQAARLASQNATAFAGLDIQAVISCASGCTESLANSLRDSQPYTQDINYFLDHIDWPDGLHFRALKQRVAVHEPCSLRNSLKQQDHPYSLLKHIPELQVQPLPDNGQCCGAAGSYMLEQPEMADRLLADKLEAIDSTRPEILVSSNIGCALHLAKGIRQSGHSIEVVHPVTLLARQLVS